MNERIKELREQSIKWAYENQQSMDGAMDKLAELIVRECVNIIDPKTGTKWIKDQTQEEFWKNQSVHLIKKHFGVE